jgi:hypothetical protein
MGIYTTNVKSTQSEEPKRVEKSAHQSLSFPRSTHSHAFHNHDDRSSLFLQLSPERLLQVFQFIGVNDMKLFIRLVTCCDPYLERFIYRECTFLWRTIDLKNFPGINDMQLESLLRRINAQQSVTRSFILDKNTLKPITGAGLEPLRYSKVLKSVDLRQTTTLERRPTGLCDSHVARILRTMMSYQLETVKVRWQHAGRQAPWSV